MTRIGWRVTLGAVGTVAVAIAAVLIVLVGGGSSDASAVSGRALAGQVASRLIDSVRVPGALAAAGAEPATGTTLAQLSRATGPVTVERSRSWRVRRSAAVVRAALLAGPPAGTAHAPGTALDFTALRLRRGLAAARLQISVLATGPGSSVVRAVALVTWLVQRSPADRIPAGARELEITRGPLGQPPLLVLRVTAPARIARIRALIDRLELVQPGRVYHCPAQFAQVPVVSFAFRAGGAHSRVLAVASEQADVRSPTSACNAVRLSVSGRAVTPLLGGYRLLRQVSELLGRRLWTPPYAA